MTRVCSLSVVLASWSGAGDREWKEADEPLGGISLGDAASGGIVPGGAAGVRWRVVSQWLPETPDRIPELAEREIE